jgi:hypothetical protein
VTAYAFARVGYHRSLDQLRRNGWKGHGPVPWEHEPNRGFLRALAALSRCREQVLNARVGEAREGRVQRGGGWSSDWPKARSAARIGRDAAG